MIVRTVGVGLIVLGLIAVVFGLTRGSEPGVISQTELQAVSARVGKVETRLDAVESGLAGINTSLDEIKGLIVGTDNKTGQKTVKQETVKIDIVQPAPAEVNVNININVVQPQPRFQPKPNIFIERSGNYEFAPNTGGLWVDGQPVASGIIKLYLTRGWHEIIIINP